MSSARLLRRLFPPRRGQHSAAAPRGAFRTQQVDPQQIVAGWITQLADADSVDEGNADVLDRMIDAWHAQQVHRIDAYYIDRRRERDQELLNLNQQLRHAQHKHAEATRKLHRWSSVPDAAASDHDQPMTSATRMRRGGIFRDRPRRDAPDRAAS